MEIRRKPGGRAGKRLFSSAMRGGSDPTEFIAKMNDLRPRLADMGEEILDGTYADLLLNSFPKEFEFIKQMHHRDRSFTLDQICKPPLIFTLTSCRGNRRGPPSVDVEQLWPPRPTPFSAIGAKLWALPVQLPWCREGTRSQTEQTEGQRQR